MLKQIEELLIECSSLAGDIYAHTDGEFDCVLLDINIKARQIQLNVEKIIRKD